MTNESKEVPEKISKVETIMHFNCNCNCIFCSFSDKMSLARKKRGYGYKKKEDIKKDIDYAKSIGALLFCFTGGEPTMRKDLPELVRYASESGIEGIQVQSNGRMFCYEDYCKTLIDAGVTEFAISLHSPKEDVNDYMMGARGAYRQSMRGIKNLRGMGQKVKVSIVITKFNYKDLPGFTRTLMGLGVSEIRYDFVVVDGLLRKNRRAAEFVVPRMSDIVPYLKECLDMYEGIDKTWMAVFNIPHCLLKDYAKHIVDMVQPATQLRGHDFVANIKDNRKRDKFKPKKCDSCFFSRLCFGIWDKYAEIYGTDEINPVKREEVVRHELQEKGVRYS
jgi:MoaA/NifB/PqqE/SkfB family radical SAM enzyme